MFALYLRDDELDLMFLCCEPIQTQNSPRRISLSLTDGKLKMFLVKPLFLSITVVQHQFYPDLTQELFSSAFYHELGLTFEIL